MQNILKRLGSAEDNIQRLDEELKKLLLNRQNESSTSNNEKSTVKSGVSDSVLDDLKIDMRDRLDVINKKINIIQNVSNLHDKDISQLRQLIDQGQRHIEESESENKGSTLNESISSDLLKLKKRVEDLDNREKKDVKDLQEEINSLKEQLKTYKNEKI